jgi:hypothetical protein
LGGKEAKATIVWMNFHARPLIKPDANERH